MTKILVFSLIMLIGTASQAHDFWIEAEPFYLEQGDKIELGLYIGVDLVGDPQPNIPEYYNDFSYIGNQGQFPVEGELGRDPAGFFQPDQPGSYMAGLQTYPQFIELKADKFNEYLADEGLESILALRQERGQSGEAAREYYQRCAKAFVVNELPGEEVLFDKAFMYNYEIFPQSNPYKTARQFAVKLLFRGQPLRDALVVAFTKQAPMKKQRMRSNDEGLAVFDISAPGLWIIKSVHMEEFKMKEADWISYWASLTFERK